MNVLDPGRVYGGGANRPLVIVELKLPNVALADPQPLILVRRGPVTNLPPTAFDAGRLPAVCAQPSIAT